MYRGLKKITVADFNTIISKNRDKKAGFQYNTWLIFN
jgi:hypothetical protein